MEQSNIRWKLRFQNFTKAYTVFQRRLSEYKEHQTEEAYEMSLIQAYEIIIELSWKVLKDYLEEEGFQEINSPKKVVKQAFQSRLISHGDQWIEALEIRNLTSHAYDENIIQNIVNFVSQDFPILLEQLHQNLKGLS